MGVMRKLVLEFHPKGLLVTGDMLEAARDVFIAQGGQYEPMLQGWIFPERRGKTRLLEAVWSSPSAPGAIEDRAQASLTLSECEKGLLVRGDTFPVKDFLKELGGTWQAKLRGWAFQARTKPALLAVLRASADIAGVEDKTTPQDLPQGEDTILISDSDGDATPPQRPVRPQLSEDSASKLDSPGLRRKAVRPGKGRFRLSRQAGGSDAAAPDADGKEQAMDVPSSSSSFGLLASELDTLSGSADWNFATEGASSSSSSSAPAAACQDSALEAEAMPSATSVLGAIDQSAADDEAFGFVVNAIDMPPEVGDSSPLCGGEGQLTVPLVAPYQEGGPEEEGPLATEDGLAAPASGVGSHPMDTGNAPASSTDDAAVTSVQVGQDGAIEACGGDSHQSEETEDPVSASAVVLSTADLLVIANETASEDYDGAALASACGTPETEASLHPLPEEESEKSIARRKRAAEAAAIRRAKLAALRQGGDAAAMAVARWRREKGFTAAAKIADRRRRAAEAVAVAAAAVAADASKRRSSRSTLSAAKRSRAA